MFHCSPVQTSHKLLLSPACKASQSCSSHTGILTSPGRNNLPCWDAPSNIVSSGPYWIVLHGQRMLRVQHFPWHWEGRHFSTASSWYSEDKFLLSIETSSISTIRMKKIICMELDFFFLCRPLGISSIFKFAWQYCNCTEKQLPLRQQYRECKQT